MGKRGRKSDCKSGGEQNQKALKACKMGKSSKASCFETAPSDKKKKCVIDPSKVNKGSKSGKTKKILTVGVILAAIVAIIFVYSLIKGMGFLKEHPEILEAAAA